MHGARCAVHTRKTCYYYKCTYSASFRARSCSRVDGTRPMYYTTTRHMRRSQEAGRRRWLWHVHGRGMRMPRLHDCRQEGKPGAIAPTAALSVCCVVVRRCVARGDVHGDATTSNI